jgi:hypothetical protein
MYPSLGSSVPADTFLTAGQSKSLLDWVIASGKNLGAIYRFGLTRALIPGALRPHVD